MIMNVAMRVAIQNGAVDVRKSTAGIASLINTVICVVSSIFAGNVKPQKSVKLWAVNVNYVRIALKRRHAAVAAKLDVGIVPYLIFVTTVTAAKLFALTVLSMRVVGVASAIIVD